MKIDPRYLTIEDMAHTYRFTFLGREFTEKLDEFRHINHPNPDWPLLGFWISDEASDPEIVAKVLVPWPSCTPVEGLPRQVPTHCRFCDDEIDPGWRERLRRGHAEKDFMCFSCWDSGVTKGD